MDEKNQEYMFKIASYQHEFEQIHKLNYQTFSEEIPQHKKNGDRQLIDTFHLENTYIICLKKDELIGMIAVRDKRPFSLDKKIGDVENCLPFQVTKLCELRLLAVKKEYRNGRVFLGLAKFIANFCLKKGYDTAVISGTIRQLRLYKQMGFEPFADLTGVDEAQFQPMYLTKQTFEQSLAGRILQPTVSFLPGPIKVSEKVSEALNQAPVSHRSEGFIERIGFVKKQLAMITNSKRVQLLLGSGTLANDVVAAQLMLEESKGLILTNGEFGERLVDQASRFGLDFDVLRVGWGEPYKKMDILELLSSEVKWIWAVHSETSTGMLNNIELLKQLSQEKDIKLCLDCISSLGTIPLDLEGVYLATGVSGKAIGGFTGLSFVFHNHKVQPSSKIPKYLDLGYYESMNSIPFSHSSNLIMALSFALSKVTLERYENIRKVYTYLYQELQAAGFHIVTPEAEASPIIITLEIPRKMNSVIIGDNLFYQGYQLHYESSYLKKRNWIQIACVGFNSENELLDMVQLLLKELDYEWRHSCEVN